MERHAFPDPLSVVALRTCFGLTSITSFSLVLQGIEEMRLSVDFGTLDSAGIWRCAAIMEVGSVSPTSTKINKLPVRPLAGPGLTIKIGRPRSQTPPVLPLPVRLQTVGIPARAGNRFAA